MDLPALPLRLHARLPGRDVPAHAAEPGTPQPASGPFVTPAGELLAAEIRRDGPIPFRRFMEVALYHPEHGYYRRPRDPFGKHGDFFTAEQIQPVFGNLMASFIGQLYRQMGEPRDFAIVELRAGRCEMAGAFAEWRY